MKKSHVIAIISIFSVGFLIISLVYMSQFKRLEKELQSCKSKAMKTGYYSDGKSGIWEKKDSNITYVKPDTTSKIGVWVRHDRKPEGQKLLAIKYFKEWEKCKLKYWEYSDKLSEIRKKYDFSMVRITDPEFKEMEKYHFLFVEQSRRCDHLWDLYKSVDVW